MNQQDKDRLRELAETAIRGSGGDLTPTLDFESACSPQAILSLLEENERLAKDAERYEELLTVLGMEHGEGDPAAVIQRLQDLAALSATDVVDQIAAMQHKGE